MIFARRGDGGAGFAHRPVLLLITEDYALPPGLAACVVAAEAAGFRAVATPWFALALDASGIAACAGVEALAGGAWREIAAPEMLRPDAVTMLAAPERLSRAARRAVAGLINGSDARVIAPLADAAPLPDPAAPASAGALSFAPLHGWPAATDETAPLKALGATLAEGALGAVLHAAGDPTRVLMPVRAGGQDARFGFVAADGATADAALLDAWLAAALARCAPRAPFLLPSPSRPAERVSLCSGAAPERLDPARPPAAHALAAVLPSPADGHVLVPTVARADATFDFLHPDLRGPTFADMPQIAPEVALLRQTARSIDIAGAEGATADPLGWRLVEPGVGRAVLVDHLALAGRPDLIDFTAVGVGLTPYSRGGFVDVGRAIDGLAALCRARHRRACAERLEAGECRAAPVVGIATLANDVIDVPGIGRLQAAVAVRGFRCVLRVKQLDPVAGFYHSRQYAPLAHDFLMHPLWESCLPAPDRQGLLMALDVYAAASSLSGLTVPPLDLNAARARARRLQVVRLYAPIVLETVRARLAVELGRDPITELPSVGEYVDWFARSLGRQFAQFRRMRFVHDYHQPEIGRAASPWLYTLGENNVTLMAEFADLDTGVFVDRYDPEHFDEIFLSRADFAALADGFERAHARDVAAGREVLRTLAFVALGGDPADVAAAEAVFDEAYGELLERAA